MKAKVLLVVLASVLIPAGVVKTLELSVDKQAIANFYEEKDEKITTNHHDIKNEDLSENHYQEKSTRHSLNNNAKNSCIAREEVILAQSTWGDGIVSIGETYQSNGHYKDVAAELVDDLYGYDEGTVLFKPTKAAEREFRLTEAEAVSYFVTGVISEDHGFAIQPWSKVRFKNAGIIINCNSALAMGDYFFTDANTNKEVKAEYTFAYYKDKNGKLLINLHHSSFPYHPEN